jgi:hypothetical protein
MVLMRVQLATAAPNGQVAEESKKNIFRIS